MKLKFTFISIFLLVSMLLTNLMAQCQVSTTIQPAQSNGMLNCIQPAILLQALSTGTGNVSNYTYLWNTGQNSEVITVNTPGVYTVTATNPAGGCTATANFVVVANFTLPSITISASNTTIPCGQTATLIASGADSYQWSDGSQSVTDIIQTGGTYTVVGTSIQSGCTETASITIQQQAYLCGIGTASITSFAGTIITCNDPAMDLSADITGGTSNPNSLTYQWSNGETNRLATVTQSGTYTVTVTDASAGATCSRTASINITRNTTKPVVTITPNPVNIPCGQSAVLTATSTTPNLDYYWQNSLQPNNLLTVNLAGTYIATGVNPINGCSGTASVIVQTNNLIVSNSFLNPVCNGSNGTATAMVSNGVAPFTYLWSTGAQTQTITNLPQGVYIVTVTDATGCSNTHALTLANQATQFQLSVTGTNVSACGSGNSGSSQAFVNGQINNTQYTYIWSNGATTSFINNLQVATYTVTATAAGGCGTATATTTIINNTNSFFIGKEVIDNINTPTSDILTVSGHGTATITNVNQIKSVFTNLEHSFMGDLIIDLICPNGQTTNLKSGTGGNTFLGTPCAQTSVTDRPGIYALYQWSPSATVPMENGTTHLVTNICSTNTRQSLNTGVYAAVGGFNNLVGCPIDGNWTLKITDRSAIDNGYFEYWGLSFGGVCNSNENYAHLPTTNPSSGVTFTGSATINASGLLTHASGGYHHISASTGSCQDSLTIFIPNTNFSISSIAANCGQSNGSATVTLAAGSTAQWSNGATGATATNLAPGWYSVTVSSASCTEHQNFEVQMLTTCKATIKGTVVRDANANCQKETTETVGDNLLITCTNTATGITTYDYTNATGDYIFVVDTGRYVITYAVGYCNGWDLLCPSSGNISVYAALANTIYRNNNFYTAPTANGTDLSIAVYSTPPQPGFVQHYYIYPNLSSGIINATTTFNWDARFTNFTIVSGAQPTSIVGNTATWNIPVAAGNSTTIHAIVYVPTSVPIGVNTHGSAAISFAGVDVCPANNTVAWCQLTTNAYDPNDKQLISEHNDDGSVTAANTPLRYNINFQNLGTAVAYNVRVDDALDLSRVDAKTIRLVGSSAPCELEWKGTNTLIFHFKNINLDFAANNDAASRGWVQFEVMPKAGTVYNNTMAVNNTASIVFDYNAAIVTNTVHTAFVSYVGTEELTAQNISLEVYPNPTDGAINARFTLNDSEAITASITDIAGKTVAVLYNGTATEGVNTLTYDTQSLAAGMYHLIIQTSRGIVAKKIAVVK